MSSEPTTLNDSLAALRRFAPRRDQPAARCELCGAELAAEHAHLIDPQTRRLLCSCEACGLLFEKAAEQKYRRVPRYVRPLPDFVLSDAQWNALLIPIEMAFFFHSSAEERVVALYPSPAGATESLLDLSAWGDIVRDNPVLGSMQADVEALLVNRLGRTPGRAAGEYYLAPIDKCYELVGLIRANWRGLSGGTEVWQKIAAFFDALKGEARCSI